MGATLETLPPWPKANLFPEAFEGLLVLLVRSCLFGTGLGKVSAGLGKCLTEAQSLKPATRQYDSVIPLEVSAVARKSAWVVRSRLARWISWSNEVGDIIQPDFS